MVQTRRRQRQQKPWCSTRRHTRCRRGIGALREGELAKFGYSHVSGLSLAQRHRALGAAVAAYGALSVFRKLHAVAIYSRRSAPSSARIFRIDRDWVRVKWLS
jgi:hypothetical protein